MMRGLCALALLLALWACSSRAQRTAVQSKTDDVTSVEASRVAMRNGASGVPLSGVVVTGTIRNAGSAPMSCRPTEFLLIDASGNANLPRLQWCTLPTIPPRSSTNFTATFSVTDDRHLQLRFEHPDGSYEAHPIALPPA